MHLRGLETSRLGLLFVLLTACRAAPAHTSSADPPPIEVRPITPPKVAVVDAAAPAAPNGTRTPEGFLRTRGTLTKRERHVNVVELPLGTLPIDVDMTGSATPTVSARLKRELGFWPVKDIGATPTRSPDGKYALLEGGSPKELVVAELTFDTRGAPSGLGKIVRRAKNPYRTLMWIGPHDLVADDGRALLRGDGSGSTPFVSVGRSPKLGKSTNSREEVFDFDPSVAQALTHYVGSEIYGMRNASILDLKTGTRRRLIELEMEKKKQEIVDMHFGLERTCVVRFEREAAGADRADRDAQPLPPATYLCAPTPWQPDAFEPIFTTRSGAGYLATANKRIVLLVDRELHVFDIEAKTERVYPAPVAYSVAPLDDKAKYMLSPGPHPLVLDIEAETIDALDAWVPPDVGGYTTSVLAPSPPGENKRLRVFVETHGDRFQRPAPNERRLFILEIE